MYEDKNEAHEYLRNLVESGQAIEKFRELIIAQGGDPEVIENYATQTSCTVSAFFTEGTVH